MGPVTGTNLALQSEDLSTTWTALRSTINTNAVVAPDGLTTADTVVEDTTASNNHYVFQNFTLDADKIYVYSFYAKAIGGATNRNIAVQVQAKDNSFPGVIIDPSAGTVGSTFGGSIAGGIQDVGNDWYRGHVVFDSQSGGVNGQLYAIFLQDGGGQSYTGDGSSGMHLWGFQLEQAPTFLDAPAEDFSDADWLKTRLTVSADAIAAPDGNVTADKIVETTDTGSKYVRDFANFVYNKTYTLSVFAKSAGRDYIVLWTAFGSGGKLPKVFTVFNLANGTIHYKDNDEVSSSISDVGNGWYRCSVTVTAIETGSEDFAFSPWNGVGTFDESANVLSYTGDGSSGLYLWGAQVEEGASATPYPPVPTKYLPTYASTDLPFVGYNQNQGTINSEFTALGSTAFSRFYDLVDNTDALNEKISLSNRSASDPDEGTESIVTGGSNSIFNVFDLTPNVFIKYSRAYKTNDSAAEIKDGTGGVDSHSDTSVTLPTTINELGIGVRPDNGANVGNFVMKRFHYYASRLKDDFLKRLR